MSAKPNMAARRWLLLCAAGLDVHAGRLCISMGKFLAMPMSRRWVASRDRRWYRRFERIPNLDALWVHP